MANSRCTSCGLIHQRGQCTQQTSTTHPDKPLDITPTLCCTCYLFTIAFFVVIGLVVIGFSKIANDDRCYVEIFANSISVSNATENVSAADWRIGFVAKSPITGCKISLHTLSWRLLRGNQVISNSSSPLSDCFGQYIAGGKTNNVVFEKVVMPKVIDDVIWDFRVEIVSAVNTDARHVKGFVMAACPDIPVKFTTDPAGKVMGSLLGNMRLCDYEFRDHFFRLDLF